MVNGLEETASYNLVTAIYLDYRLFDTYIEAIILFVAVRWYHFYVETRSRCHLMKLFCTISS